MLAIYEDMSNAEIARELHLPVRVVENGKKRLHRAARKIYSDEHDVASVQVRGGVMMREEATCPENRPAGVRMPRRRAC